MGMIDAKQAKEILGCDDATLQNHVNNGAVKAQRQGGKLLVDEDDIKRLASREDEENTIVLTGESDNLQIDLGKVVDDSSETIVQSGGKTPKPGGKDTQQITFSDDLEVVSLDDAKDQAQTKATTAAQGLSFTDSNTAVVTSVEETAVGATTAPIDTGVQAAAGRRGTSQPLPSGDSNRRSVRSSRRLPEEAVQVHWLWMAVACLTFIVGATLIAPYYVIGLWATGAEKDYGGYTVRGVDDSGWTNMAGGVAGFHVEPNIKKYQALGGAGEHKDISVKDPQASWRFTKYQDGMKAPGERVSSFVITQLSPDGTKATSKAGREYPVHEKTVKIENGPELKAIEVEVWPAK
jgi:hypothetical protein